MTKYHWMLVFGALASLAAPSVSHAQSKSTPTADARAEHGSGTWIKEFGTMWTFDAPPLAYWKRQYGFEPTQEWLDNVRMAAVRIPGCSASFVSEQGLVLTNHHCARRCISAVSPADSNYQETGFVAKDRSEERSCPNMYADQLQSIEDVTEAVRGAVTAKTNAARVAQRDSAIQAIQGQCGRETGLQCQVVTLYQGGKYSLYRFRRYTDVRLVMAPEETISFFGGDPDNFTYPRYDLDLTLLRVYQDGKPIASQHYFKWNSNGPKDGELTFTIGNPGSTGRLLTFAQMEYLRDAVYPAKLDSLKAMIGVYKELMNQSEANKRIYENQVFGLENSFKAITGYQVGLLDSAIMARKKAFEDDFRRRIKADKSLQAKYGDAWEVVARSQKELSSFAPELRFQVNGGSRLFRMAGLLVSIATESGLPDSLRTAPFRGSKLDQVRAEFLRDTTPINPAIEKLLLAAQFRLAQKALPATDPFIKAALGGRSPEVAAEALIDGTDLESLGARKQLLEGGLAGVKASKDPLLVLARTVEPMARRNTLRAEKASTIISANVERIGQALYAAYGTALPPDATFTLRITDGIVKGFPYNGTIAPHKTSYYGLYARNVEFADQPPFQLPPRWKAARDRINMAAGVNFVLTADIIGGNSGSPVINRNGEVVGLIFDGNIESLPNRFIFTDDVARAVAVHTQGMTEALRVIYGAEWLVNELEKNGVPASK